MFTKQQETFRVYENIFGNKSVCDSDALAFLVDGRRHIWVGQSNRILK